MTLKYVALALVLLAVAAALYVRFAPLSAEKYHVDLRSIEGEELRGQFSVGRNGDIASPYFEPVNLSAPEAAKRVREVIEATPRTTMLAGSLDAGDGPGTWRATYVTRSALWGFPDMTTVELETANIGLLLSITGRLVYGVDDLGVNEARIRRWLDEIKFD